MRRQLNPCQLNLRSERYVRSDESPRHMTQGPGLNAAAIESTDSNRRGHDATVDSPAAATRRELVERAVHTWSDQLVDLSGRNGLLYYRDLRVGTLDLGSADPVRVPALLGGESVRLSALFSDDALKDAAHRLRRIRAKARENLEERGIDTLFLARGMATWTPPTGSAAVPSAPILLYQLTVTPRGSQEEDFDLSIEAATEINPTLRYALEETFGLLLSELEPLSNPAAVDDSPLADVELTFRHLADLAASVPGFAIVDRVVVGNFTYTKLPMVTDLQENPDALTAHDLIAAIAGDQAAQTTIRARQVSVDPRDLDEIVVADEFLVRDADASQQAAIRAVVAGSDQVVQGPPGTGKSQTIANLIASLTARGQRVLFVAEKRAAIDAVIGRLAQVGLSDLVLDLHSGIKSRRRVAESLATSLEAARTAPTLEVGDLQLGLEARRQALRAHDRAMNEIREPWGLTFYEAQARSIGSPSSGRMTASALDEMTPDRLRATKEALRRYVILGGSRLRTETNPWLAAGAVDQAAIERLSQTVHELDRDVLPRFRLAVARDQLAVGSEPRTLGDAIRLITLLGRLGALRDQVVDGGLPALGELSASLQPARDGRLHRLVATLVSPSYRRAVKAGRILVAAPTVAIDALGRLAEEAASVVAEWRRVGGDAARSLPASDPEATAIATQIGELLKVLAEWLEPIPMDDTSLVQACGVIHALVEDLPTLRKLPELRTSRATLEAAGVGWLLEDPIVRGLDDAGAVQALDAAWAGSIVERVTAQDPAVGAFDGARLSGEVNSYMQLDSEHLATAAGRVKRAWAERAVAARDAHADQDMLVRAQARRKTGHLPIRDLFVRAPDVLTAVKPCWAMSPLLVSQILPASPPYFDIVIFDEASQIPPADAIPSILRGRRVVVAGDDLQLPPTTFFASQTAADTEAAEEPLDGEGEALTSGFPSILDVVDPLMRSTPLRWHYRSHDERLIAFSNLQIYRPKQRELTTFPGVSDEEPIRHVQVDAGPALGGTDSSREEVDAVVRLILAHASERPNESLGVIAMGIKHADRIQEAVRQARLLRRDLDTFFAETGPEPFFVKNLERVQGDERDAIILTIGYSGRGPDGGIRHQFGPLNQQGGERRLNVAVTRAKCRVTVVSSFGSEEIDPSRSSAEGVRLLRAYLRYAESGGADLGEVVPARPEINAFERDVLSALEDEGFHVIPQLGTSGYYLDFAVQHPAHPGRFILAIECDGATYHSAPNTRERDRLRQQQLEAIGWRFHRIWSPDWFHDRSAEVIRIKEAIAAALAADGDRRDQPRLQPPVLPDSSSFAVGSAVGRSLPRPRFYPYGSIDRVPRQVLDDVIRWIESDDKLRTEDELVGEAVQALGFGRRGRKIREAILASIARVRAHEARRNAVAS